MQICLDQIEYSAIGDPLRHFVHQTLLGDCVEVLAYVDVDHVHVSGCEQSFDFSQCILASEIGAEAVAARIKFVLEDRFDDVSQCRLDDAIDDRWDSEGTLLWATEFRNVSSPYW
jgi:hypothetical protein